MHYSHAQKYCTTALPLLSTKADSSLCYVIAVRYDIVYLSHMVQVFDETDIQFIRDFHIKLFYGAKRLQCNHLSHEFDVFGRDRLVNVGTLNGKTAEVNGTKTKSLRRNRVKVS